MDDDDRERTEVPPRFDDAGDATRRTWLANERTWLAWVRTGLTSTAVAIGIGKLVPELADSRHKWPFEALGVGYAVVGVVLALYGFIRREEVERAIERGRYVAPHDRVVGAFALALVVLGVATAVVVLVG
ncbi:MAG TPA: DUF202 domain-containing protein [Solirubrobacteraceae bacterium]|nr:DUF202 domain-containing protein [Solirubrobacteraceae bacterium]